MIHIVLRKYTFIDTLAIRDYIGGDTLHDDDCTIDNNSKVERTKTHQVASYTESLHHTESKEHGKRNDRCCH